MNPPDTSVEQSAFEALSQLPRNEGGPLFAEPWQAAAFAVAVSLSRQGYFSWKEWAAALAEELKRSAARGEPDDGTHYYHCWLATLERLVVAKGLSQSAELSRCKKAWAEAYRRTPHGKPVELGSAVSGSRRSPAVTQRLDQQGESGRGLPPAWASSTGP